KADRNYQLVESQLLLAYRSSEADGDFLALDFRGGQTSAQQDLQALLGKHLEGFLGNLLIGSRQELVHCLNNGNFGTQARPYRAEFEANDTCTDHAQTRRNGLEVQCTSGIDDDLLIDRSRRNVDWLGAGCENDVRGRQGLSAAVELGDFDLLAGQQLAVAFENGHAVGLEQC